MILCYEANIGLIYYGPKWSWAEMVMGRNDPESKGTHVDSLCIQMRHVSLNVWHACPLDSPLWGETNGYP